MICRYRFTKKQGIMVLLLAAILGSFLVIFRSPAAASDSQCATGGTGCREDQDSPDDTAAVAGAIAERNVVQSELHFVRRSNTKLANHHQRKKTINEQRLSADRAADYLERDLHLCNLTAFTHRKRASKQHQDVYMRLKAFDSFLPTSYLDNYTNPCWYSKLQPPAEIGSKMYSTRSITTPLVFLTKAASVVKEVFDKESEKEAVFTCLPAFYLAGFAKSGTTTLFSYLMSHPLLRKPAQKEGHFWRSFLTIPMNYTHKQMQVMWYMQHFSKAAQYIKTHPNAVTIDASASTMWIPNPLYGNSYFFDRSNQRYEVKASNPDSHENVQDLCFIPMVVHSILPDAKFVVIMRDPVKRLFSDYWYFCANKNKWKDGEHVPKRYMENAPQIFHNATVLAIQKYNACRMDSTHFTCLKEATLGYSEKGDCFPLRLGVGMYYYHIVKWMNVYPQSNFHFLRLEDMATDTYNSVAKTWEFMGLSPIPKSTFESEISKTVLNEMSWIKQPGFKERFYLLPETEKILGSFYKPFNRKLAQLLGNDDYMWTTGKTSFNNS